LSGSTTASCSRWRLARARPEQDMVSVSSINELLLLLYNHSDQEQTACCLSNNAAGYGWRVLNKFWERLTRTT
jgi:hypothetical protein